MPKLNPAATVAIGAGGQFPDANGWTVVPGALYAVEVGGPTWDTVSIEPQALDADDTTWTPMTLNGADVALTETGRRGIIFRTTSSKVRLDVTGATGTPDLVARIKQLDTLAP